MGPLGSEAYTLQRYGQHVGSIYINDWVNGQKLLSYHMS